MLRPGSGKAGGVDAFSLSLSPLVILRHRELPGARAPVTASENPSRVLFKGLVAIGRRDLAGKCPPARLLFRAAPGASQSCMAPLECSRALQGCSDHGAVALALNLSD